MKAARVCVKTGSWQAWVDVAFAAAIVVFVMLGGHPIGMILVIPSTAMLLAYALWRWLADAEVSFDAVGVLVSDRYWRLSGRQPIMFRYCDGIEVAVQSGRSFGVAWVNGIRIAAGGKAGMRLEQAARSCGLRFTPVGTTITSVAPTILIVASVAPLFMVRGLLGWLLYSALYGAGLLTVLVPFFVAHRSWESIAATRGGH